MDLGTLVPIAAPVTTVIAAAVAAQPLLRQYELKAKRSGGSLRRVASRPTSGSSRHSPR